MLDQKKASLDFKKEIGIYTANVHEAAKIERNQIEVDLQAKLELLSPSRLIITDDY